MKRALLGAFIGVFALVAGGLLLRFGMVSSCGILKKDGKPDEVRTSEGGKTSDWQILVQEILQHALSYEKEYAQLGVTLDKLFTIVSEYQRRAA